jgi:signal transduction histidine kinase
VTFRTRAFVALALAAVAPLALLAYGVRGEVAGRLSAENAREGEAALRALRDDLAREGDAIAARLATLSADLERDNRLRLAVVGRDAAGRRALLDLAGESMRTAGLDLLRIQDSAGRILSSGHFRNEYDRVEPGLLRALASAGAAPVLVRARTADSAIVVLARLDSVRVAAERLMLVGGSGLASVLDRELARDPDLAIAVRYPGGPTGADSAPRVGEVTVPFLDLTGPAGSTGESGRAMLLVTRSSRALTEVRRGLDRWFLAAVGATVALALVAAAWLAARVSRPLTALAARTAAIDLDRLDGSFASDRDDEIGALTGVLGAMTERLRASAGRLREAERRVATGDLARQVNHDVKNGLVPIRNVLRHLAQVAREEPASLARVFEERRGTLESSLEYLDTLARNYARLSPSAQPRACDVTAVVDDVIRATAAGQTTLRTVPDPARSRVSADPLVLRRILENLVGNAIDSVAGRGEAVVTVSTERVGDPGARARVRVTVADTGPGMTRAELERAFEDFHTTKAGGTGLGLSIVRRLVVDLGGALRIETEPGAGTRAIVELPADGMPVGTEGQAG